MSGPLSGLRVLELAGLGPAPFCAMLLADMGAEVIRIDRVAAVPSGFDIPPDHSILNRGRRSLAIDLKKKEGVDLFKRMATNADIVLEGFRPGVMEKLGLGPDDLAAVNDRIVYGRVTGWGQSGPMHCLAGHDINYIALTGALHAIGGTNAPTPPLNLLGDFAGGAMYLAFGVLTALLERVRSGRGQTVDAAMTEGVTSLSSSIMELRSMERWNDLRQNNHLDGGAPWYAVYRTSDDNFVAIGAIEDRFYEILLETLGLSHLLDLGREPEQWATIRQAFESAFLKKTRAQWCTTFADRDACFSPVLTFDEAPDHAHNLERAVYVSCGGRRQPAPAPRLGRTPGTVQYPSRSVGQDTIAVLSEMGLTDAETTGLLARGIVAAASGGCG